MAGNQNSGGDRPTAPQNNPANISLTGGAGQSGNYTGFAYRQNKALNDSRMQGNAAVASVNAAAPAAAPMQLPPVTGITAPSELPNQSVLDGVPIGPGANSVAGLPTPMATDNTQFDASIQSYSQVLQFVASQPNTSKETRAAINTLLRGSQV